MASGSGLAEGRAAEAGAAVDTLPSRSLLGFPLCTAEPAAILGWLDQRLADKVQTHVVTLNPEMVLLDRMRARAHTVEQHHLRVQGNDVCLHFVGQPLVQPAQDRRRLGGAKRKAE